MYIEVRRLYSSAECSLISSFAGILQPIWIICRSQILHNDKRVIKLSEIHKVHSFNFWRDVNANFKIILKCFCSFIFGVYNSFYNYEISN